MLDDPGAIHIHQDGCLVRVHPDERAHLPSLPQHIRSPAAGHRLWLPGIRNRHAPFGFLTGRVFRRYGPRAAAAQQWQASQAGLQPHEGIPGDRGTLRNRPAARVGAIRPKEVADRQKRGADRTCRDCE